MFKRKRLTIVENIKKRKYISPNRLFYFLLTKLVLKPFLVRKFNVNYNKIDKVPKKGPFFVIFNHQSRLDYLWAVPLAMPRPLNFVVAYNEHFRSHLKFIFNALHVIPKRNFTLDIDGMRAIDSVIKHGGAVAFAPEAMSSIYGTNQPIVPGTGKLFKKYGVPIYFVETHGAYLSNTKVCLDNRYGRVDASIRLLFSKEQLEKMSGEEIDKKINEVFRIDDYAWQRKEHILWKTNGRICEHLSDINYRCPKCHSDLTMISSGNTIKCTKCGNEAKMNDYYEFEPTKGSIFPISPSEWVLEERKAIIEEIRKNKDYEFSFKTKIGFLPEYHYLENLAYSEIRGEGIFKIDHQGVHFVGTKDGKPYSFDLTYKDVYTLGMPENVTFFSLYVGSEYIEFRPEQPVVGKTLLLVEETHRLHENYWKNFPWLDYLYK